VAQIEQSIKETASQANKEAVEKSTLSNSAHNGSQDGGLAKTGKQL